MSHLVIFPWIDRQEVRHVYEEIYSNDQARQKHALERIATWKSRVGNRLPVAVESTASLVGANLKFLTRQLTEDDSHLRSIYSIAVIRFVNHITEKGQNRANAIPIHVLASNLGVPEWIVELRHFATHNNLPSLTELRAAATWSLSWLKTEFWELQMVKTFGLVTNKSVTVDSLKAALVRFQQKKFAEMSGGNKAVGKRLLGEIESCFSQLGRQVCEILTEDGYLVPTVEQLQSIGLTKDDVLGKKLLLPIKVLTFWKKVLHLLNKCGLIQALLINMLSQVDHFHTLRNKLLLGWVYSIIKQSNAKKSKKKTFLLFKSNVDISYKQLLECCIFMKSENSKQLVALLVNKMNPAYGMKDKLKKVVLIQAGNQDDIETEVMVTEDEIINFLRTRKVQTKWHKDSSVVDWSAYAFGVLPHQQVSYRSLELISPYPSEDESVYQLEDIVMEESAASVDSQDISFDVLPDVVPDANIWNNNTMQEIASKLTMF